MAAPRLTTDDYLRTPETLLPQELVFGYVRDAPAPTWWHQDVVGDLYVCLRRHLEQTGAGRVCMAPVDVVLDHASGLVVQPDLVVVGHERQHIIQDRVYGAPDLVIDILSPNVRIGSLDERLSWFARYGVRECWLVRRVARAIDVVTFAVGTIESRQRIGPGDEMRSGVLPDLRATPGSIIST
ncbi:MAG: Uma2 family endonuclease [Vicinamibacterales bacterium]